jgi:hypothetical protein
VTDATPRALIVTAAAVAVGCAALVIVLFAAGLRTQDSASVDDLPTVAEVIVAEAHRHGIELPDLTDEQRQALENDRTDATDASAYEQLSLQLSQVSAVEGVDAAVFLLGEVSAVSAEAARSCARLYDELIAKAAAPPASPCR